jgi:hypothetical protein
LHFWKIVLGESVPAFNILGRKLIVELCPRVRVLIGDVAQREEDVDQRSSHTKCFVAKASVKECESGLGSP